MTRIWATALGAALAISALFLASSTTLAGNSTISLEVEPGEIELCGQSTQTFQVMAYNNGATPRGEAALARGTGASSYCRGESGVLSS